MARCKMRSWRLHIVSVIVNMTRSDLPVQTDAILRRPLSPDLKVLPHRTVTTAAKALQLGSPSR